MGRLHCAELEKSDRITGAEKAATASVLPVDELVHPVLFSGKNCSSRLLLLGDERESPQRSDSATCRTAAVVPAESVTCDKDQGVPTKMASASSSIPSSAVLNGRKSKTASVILAEGMGKVSTKKLSEKGKAQPWNWAPLCTPKTLLVIFVFYTLTMLIFGSLYFSGAAGITEISIELKPNIGCDDYGNNDVETTVDGAENVQRTCVDSTSATLGTARMLESITFTTTEDMEGPLLLYYELDGVYQGHRGFIRGSENAMSAKQVRTGSCMAYQKPRTDCVAESNAVFMLGTESWESAAYALWYPFELSKDSSGCYMWWSSLSKQCIKDGNNDESSVCKSGPSGQWPPPVTDNRVYYPCGFAAKMATEDGLDTMVLTVPDASVAGNSVPLGTADAKPETVAFDADFSYAKRNLDPERVFDKAKDQVEDKDLSGLDLVNNLDGKEFYKILDMHLLRHFPPTVCSDDPLRLQPLQYLADNKTPNCANYKDFQFEAATNGATCQYSTTSVPNPLTPGTNIACTTKLPNPAGWGLEHSDWLNWQRIAGYWQFRKLNSKITLPTSTIPKGTQLRIFYAHRLDLKKQAGNEHDIKKRVVLTTAHWVGSKNVIIGGTFIACGGICFFVVLLLLWIQVKDPDRLDNIQYLAWRDYRWSKAAAAASSGADA
ncbi:unnamed protein product [Amoebophrya sp. A120]|nr:unnamed protein product [Amoebophrya sp. A120]|eukprot:GSA120T00020176001.1